MVHECRQNNSGHLGVGTDSSNRYTPGEVLGVGGSGYLGDGGPISQIAAGNYHTVALKSDGTRVYAWGYNSYGQLGDNTTSYRYTPVEVLGLGGTGYLGDDGPISQISAGDYHTVALKEGGTRV